MDTSRNCLLNKTGIKRCDASKLNFHQILHRKNVFFRISEETLRKNSWQWFCPLCNLPFFWSSEKHSFWYFVDFNLEIYNLPDFLHYIMKFPSSFSSAKLDTVGEVWKSDVAFLSTYISKAEESLKSCREMKKEKQARKAKMKPRRVWIVCIFIKQHFSCEPDVLKNWYCEGKGQQSLTCQKDLSDTLGG